MHATTNLLRFDEVRHMPVVVRAAHIEPRPRPFAAQPRHDHGARLPTARVHRAHLHRAAHRAQQPHGRVHAVPHQMRVQHPVPEEARLGGGTGATSTLRAQRQIEDGRTAGGAAAVADVATRSAAAAALRTEVERARVQHLAHLRDAVLARLLQLQRHELRLGDAKDLRVTDAADREAAGDQHQIQHRRFAGVQLQHAQTAVRIGQFRVLLADRVRFVGGCGGREGEEWIMCDCNRQISCSSNSSHPVQLNTTR